jgi:acetyl-CoA carboxylase biotin carboxyl carrier protein
VTTGAPGRRHARRVDAIWTEQGASFRLASPVVGVFRPGLAVGAPVMVGAGLGTVEVLGQDLEVIAPAGSRGVVVSVAGDGRARAPVGYGAALYTVDPDAAAAARPATTADPAGGTTADTLVFVAPTSGRFYGRPGPGKPPFVAVGDVLGEGHTVCMLEVMKTFNRVTYGGPGLPPRAVVTAILVADESDVDAGAPLIRLEPAP